MRRAAASAAIVGLAITLLGCSDRVPERNAERGSERPPDVEQFDGSVDDFYVVPDPLPTGAPGSLIRIQAVPGTAGAPETTTRIMYHSRDATGRDRAVTGLVTAPTKDGPENGWPILAVAPGTVGLNSSCALSRSGSPVAGFGLDGVKVMTDYIGMGPVGEIHPYLSRLSEGHSVLDGARAARALVEGSAGRRLLIFGHSQGGHGAESAHELAATYAPELDLVGTVSGAPAAMFERSYGGVDDIVSRIVTTMSVYGMADEHPEVDIGTIMSDAAQRLAPMLETACLAEVIDAFVPLAAAPDYWRTDPRNAEPMRSILRENDIGNVRAEAPLLLISGTADERVVHQRVLDLFERLCDAEQITELVVLEGADHGSEIPRAGSRIGAWFTDRLAGRPPTDSCSVRNS